MAIKRDKILKNAEKLVQKGKLEQAIREFEKLLQASPDDTNTINRLGDLCGRVGEIDKAVTLYEQVAVRFADQGFLPKAIAIYKKINRLAPQRLDIFERLGELYIEQGLTVEAKSQFQMLAEHYAKNEDMESAIRAHQRLSEIDPNDSSTRLKFADMLLQAGNAEEAMAAYGALGETLIQRDQLDEAERLFRRLIDHELPDGEIMGPVCDRLLDSGRVTAAQELLTAGLAVSPESVALRTLQVRAFMSLGETDSAVGLAREILEIDPDNPTVRGLVGNVLISDGDQKEAAEMMIPAAEALLEKADYSRAQKMLRELVEIAPTDERILRLAIRAFRPSGDQETLTRLTASLADVCFNNGQEDQAKRFYLELVATDPANELYRGRLAQLDGAVPDAVDGVQTSGFGRDVPSEITFAIDVDEDEAGEAVVPGLVTDGAASMDPTERINEAKVFAKYGLNDKAISHLEEVVAQSPDHEGAREALAAAHIAVGQRDRASQIIAPVIAKHRADGDQAAAEELEKRFGASSLVVEEDDEDDEVIIVEIDGDETPEATVETFEVAAETPEVIIDEQELVVDEPEAAVEMPEAAGETSEAIVEDLASDVVGLSDVNLDDMVAQAMGDLDLSGSGARTVDAASETDALLADVLNVETMERRPRAADAVVVDDVLVGEPPAEDILVEDVQLEEAPVEETLVEEELIEEAPVEETLVEEELIEEAPVEEVLIEEELVEEELVEISAGVDGPSFNELAQLDLFVEQELLEDAVVILARLEAEYPDDSDLAVRRQKLEDLGAMDQPTATDGVPEDVGVAELTEVVEPLEESDSAGVGRTPVEPVRSPDDIFDDEQPDDYIDLAKELEEELAEEEAMVEEATGRGKGEALLDEVFKEFQKGVAEQLSDEDSDTHFNLGIAYKEMGLLNEAIGEFQVASHDPAYFVEACSMIGVCANELGRHDEAAEWYQKALVAPDLSTDARTALRYELAAAFEKSGKLQEAVDLFQDIQSTDPEYRDVSGHINALTQQRQLN